jgi:thioredoxin-dependent peroxiredoxin
MISVDKLEDNTAFAKQESADFPILADPTQKTANAYGVLKDYGGLGKLANRWTFYIGPDGKILAIDKAVKPYQAKRWRLHYGRCKQRGQDCDETTL